MNQLIQLSDYTYSIGYRFFKNINHPTCGPAYILNVSIFC